MLISLTATLAAATNDCLPSSAGLIGWWPGDGNANDIAGTNNGVLQGGVTVDSEGAVGQAFSFDGTSGYVEIPDSTVLRPTNLTVEAWVRFDSLDSPSSGGSPPGEQYIVFKQNTRSGNFEGYFLGKGRLAGRDLLVFGVSSTSGEAVELDSVATVTAGVWYHVAGVRGSNFIQLYVNGQLDCQANVNFPQDYGTNSLFFGTSGQAYWDHKLNGALDEVSLYNCALSPVEIAAIYAAGAAGKCKTPSITVRPQSQMALVGTQVAFTATPASAAPLSYQWQLNGTNLAEAVQATLMLTNVTTDQAGAYAVQVTTEVGTVTSPPALLSVYENAAAVLGSSPSSTSSQFQVSIAGVPGFNYSLEASTNLIDWGPLLTNTSPFTFVDKEATNFSQRFYRAVYLP